MRFYAVCTEAIRHTHRALAQLDHRRRGSLQPARTMRVATLYGHLQCRARGTGEVQLLLDELAASCSCDRAVLQPWRSMWRPIWRSIEFQGRFELERSPGACGVDSSKSLPRHWTAAIRTMAGF